MHKQISFSSKIASNCLTATGFTVGFIIVYLHVAFRLHL